MRFEFPNGKKRALTFSYDDGQIFDRRLVEIFNKYGMKATFHLNSGSLSEDRNHETFISKEEVAELYKGHEVAVHGVQHKSLPSLSKHQMIMELEDDRKALEALTGTMVQGMSYAFGSYNGDVIDVARSLGIKYSRTVNSTNAFYPPADFMAWNPSCHHDGDLMGLAERFENLPSWEELPVLYVWGHSFEFGYKNDFSVIEQFAEKLAGKDDIWYATNIEICEYIEATRKQEFSADGLTIKNPTAVTVYVSTKNGMVEVKPGECKYLGER